MGEDQRRDECRADGCRQGLALGGRHIGQRPKQNLERRERWIFGCESDLYGSRNRRHRDCVSCNGNEFRNAKIIFSAVPKANRAEPSTRARPSKLTFNARSSVMLLPPRRAKSIEAAKEENDQGAINDSIIDLLISSGSPLPSFLPKCLKTLHSSLKSQTFFSRN